MSKIAWTFAKNDGGRDNGLNDPGVETFKGNFDRYLARELGQNSLDARKNPKKPVVLRFDLLELERSDIPGIDYLQGTFVRSAKFWGHDKKALAFFKSAEKLAASKKVSVLRIGDYNTTGLLGGDADKARNWYNLIRCAGASSKSSGEGGSYGIGKKAPFAASRMRTVLYSTRNTEGQHAFIGVCDGATHELPKRAGKAQGVGFLGGKKGASVRKKLEIPAHFGRNEYGTDVLILGFPAGPSWEKDLVFSVLDNFWPAIHFGDLEVEVGKINITKKNLPALLLQYSSEESFVAHLFHQAFTAATHHFEQELPRLGKVEAFLMAGDASFPKRVAMVRKTGMVIYTKAFRSVIPFCGVFLCRSDKGNAVLREMEPPKHDAWDADHPEKGANKGTENEYVGFIRECVAKLSPLEETTIINIPGLARFLPDDDETPEEEFGEGETPEEATKESVHPNALPPKIPPAKIEAKKRSMQPDGMKPEIGDEPTEGGEGEGTGGGPGGGNNEVEGGKGGGGGGKGKGDAGAAGGAHGGVSSKPAIPIRYRAYCQDSAAGVYVLAVQAQKENDKDAKLIVWSVGDDQKVPVEIKAAKISGGAEVSQAKGGILGPIKLPHANALKVEITLRQPQRLAMEITAHEA